MDPTKAARETILFPLTLDNFDPFEGPEASRTRTGTSLRGKTYTYEVTSPRAIAQSGSDLLYRFFLHDLRNPDLRKLRHRLLSKEAERLSKQNLPAFANEFSFFTLRPGAPDHLSGTQKSKHYKLLLKCGGSAVAFSSFTLNIREASHELAWDSLAIDIDWDVSYVLRSFRGKGAGRCMAQEMARVALHQFLHVARQLDALPNSGPAKPKSVFINVCSTWASQAGFVLHHSLLQELSALHARLRPAFEREHALTWLPSLDQGADFN